MDSYLNLVKITDEITSTWFKYHGFLPSEVADKLNPNNLIWLKELTECLNIWICKGFDITQGELILARVNLGAIVECWLRFFYCVYLDDYRNDVNNGNLKFSDPDNRYMSYQRLKNFSKGILWEDETDELYFWLSRVQKYRNTIHVFNKTEIGTFQDFLNDIDMLASFLDIINIRLPILDNCEMY